MEKEDLPQFAEWVNKPEVFGEYNPLRQVSRTEMEKARDEGKLEQGEFFIERKDGGKVGYIHYRMLMLTGKLPEIGYFLVPSERGKGYCTEAIEIMVDYLFLSRDIVRVQAHTDTGNVASRKVLEKAGFKKEGIVRKRIFVRGNWRDEFLYSILGEEWKDPRILTKKNERT